MKKIFEEFGGVIIIVVAIVSLIGFIAMLIMPPNGWIRNAFEAITNQFNNKANQLISGEDPSGEAPEMELNPTNRLVPDGWIYTIAADGTKLYGGDPLPAVYANDDTMEDSDYIYTYANPLTSYGCEDLDDFKALVEQQVGMTFDEYLAAMGMTEDEFKAMLVCQWSVAVKDKSKETYNDMYSTILDAPVTYLGATFEDCVNMKVAPQVSQNATYMHSTYKNCTSLVSVPAIPSKVENMNYTFWGCTSLVTPPDMTKSTLVIEMDRTFYGCTVLEATPDLSNMVKITELPATFSGCSAVVTAGTLPESVINLNGTFGNCTSLKVAPTIPQNVTNLNNTFSGCTSLTTAPLILSTTITEMHSTFMNCESLNTYAGSTAPAGDMSGYVLPGSVIAMQYTFFNNDSIVIAPALPSNVEDISDAFSSCATLTTAPYIPASVTDMGSAFGYCNNLSGVVTVDANPTEYWRAFHETKIADIVGATTMRDELLGTI